MIVCVKCQAEMMPKKLGVTVIRTSGTPPTAVSIWRADLFGCAICGVEMLARFGHEPVIELHERGFKKALTDITKDKKYVWHSPEFLMQGVKQDVQIVRRNGTH